MGIDEVRRKVRHQKVMQRIWITVFLLPRAMMRTKGQKRISRI